MALQTTVQRAPLQRALLRNARSCLVVGYALPVVLLIYVAQRFHLADVQEGWKPGATSASPAEDTYALALAGAESLRLGAELQGMADTSGVKDTAHETRTVPRDEISLIFYSADGGDLLTTERLLELTRLERLIQELLGPFCLVGDAARPPPPPLPEPYVAACTTSEVCTHCQAELAYLDDSYACRPSPPPPSQIEPPYPPIGDSSWPLPPPRAPPAPGPPPSPPACPDKLNSRLVSAWTAGCTVDAETLEPKWSGLSNLWCCHQVTRALIPTLNPALIPTLSPTCGAATRWLYPSHPAVDAPLPPTTDTPSPIHIPSTLWCCHQWRRVVEAVRCDPECGPGFHATGTHLGVAYNVSLPCSAAADALIKGVLTVSVVRAHLAGHSCAIARRRSRRRLLLMGHDGADGDGSDKDSVDDDATADESTAEAVTAAAPGASGEEPQRNRRRWQEEEQTDSDWEEGPEAGESDAAAAQPQPPTAAEFAAALPPTADFAWDCVMRGRQRCTNNAAPQPPPTPQAAPRLQPSPPPPAASDGSDVAGATTAVGGAAAAEGCGVGDVTRLVTRLLSSGGIVASSKGPSWWRRI